MGFRFRYVSVHDSCVFICCSMIAVPAIPSALGLNWAFAPALPPGWERREYGALQSLIQGTGTVPTIRPKSLSSPSAPSHDRVASAAPEVLHQWQTLDSVGQFVIATLVALIAAPHVSLDSSGCPTQDRCFP